MKTELDTLSFSQEGVKELGVTFATIAGNFGVAIPESVTATDRRSHGGI